MSSGSNQHNQIAASTPNLADRSIAEFFSDPANANSVATNAREKGREGLRLAMLASSQPTMPIDQATGKPFPMKWYYCHAVPLVNQQTGEVDDRVRIVLISPDGQTVSCCSTGVLDSLDMIRRYEGDGPYDPPIMVKFAEQRTRQNRKILRLEVCYGDEQNPPTADGARDQRRRSG